MGTSNIKTGPTLDVERAAAVRLLERAAHYRDDCIEGTYQAGWWDGYIRCLQLILEMEEE
jgi:hypothetical protein